ncbi:MAG: hypothetical protein PVI21_02780 [Candidatus Woesebacteria bacterium]|jgi:hypothetical protein
MRKPTTRQIKDLTKSIEKDQLKMKPAEKRVKIDMTFNKAVMKMGQTPPPKKEAK